ncbi:MAG TPA: 6,7-dimethyl-8-ribityllumazine synthase [Stellaceae bacterium]|nr:6,7-dimethyl-8-ribityllumazine synthase [Stellaceae bacterium]
MPAAPHVLIVEARYYAHISDELLKGALAALEQAGASHERVTVPGAFEIPAAIKFAVEARAGGAEGACFDGFIALGCVIRGETTHYDYVCEQSSRGLQDLALAHDLPIGFGILTVENEAQALARARVGQKNKGGEAARACLAMIALKRHFGIDRP